MKVCGKCGHENTDDAEFCESCQDYLWADRTMPEDGKTVAARGADGNGSVATAVVADPVDAVPAPPPAPAPAPEEQHAAIPPAREYEPPTPTPPVFPEPEPGELICDQCGRGNRAVANFCRSCGSPLAGARVMKRPSWWRRLLAKLSRKRTYAAGERKRGQTTSRSAARKARRGVFHVTRATAFLAVLGVGAILAWRADAVGWGGDKAHDARAWLFPRYEPAHPTQVRATSHLGGHEAAAAFDGNLSTYWAEGAPGDGRGQKLVARFHRNIHVSRIGFTLGDQTKPQNFLKEPVPKRVRVTFYNRHGQHLATTRFDLADKPDFQRFSVDLANVTKVVVTIVRVFHARVGHANSITEIEFFEKN